MSDYIEQSAAQHGGVIERQQLVAFKGITREQRMEIRSWVQNDAIPVLGKLADAARHLTRHDRQSRAADGSTDRSLLSSGSAVAGSNKALFTEAAEAVLPLLSEEEAMGVRDALAKVQAPDQPTAATVMQAPTAAPVITLGTSVGDGTTGEAYKSKRNIHEEGGNLPFVNRNWGNLTAKGEYGNVFLGAEHGEAEDLLRDGTNRVADDNGRKLVIWEPGKGRLSDEEMQEYFTALDGDETDMSAWQGRKLRVVMQTKHEVMDMFTDNIAGSTAVIEQITRDIYTHEKVHPSDFAAKYASRKGAGNSKTTEENYAIVLLEALDPEFERQSSNDTGYVAVKYKDAKGNVVDAGYSEADYAAAQAYTITGKSARTILAIYFAITRHEGGGEKLTEGELRKAVDNSKMATGTPEKMTRADDHGLSDWGAGSDTSWLTTVREAA